MIGAGDAVAYDPRLVEEAVLQAVRRRAAVAPAFRRDREALYEAADPEAREARFRAFHAAWFERLGLGEPIAAALAELPRVAAGVGRVVVAPALTRADEGVELLVAPDPNGAVPVAARRTVLLRLRPETLADPGRLLALCRRELCHVDDMLDPGFGYAPRPPADGLLPEALFRERYRVLWGVRVAGRCRRQGWAPPGDRETWRRTFAATFPMLGPRLEAAFERLYGETPPAHPDLVAYAVHPERMVGGDPTGPRPGERCPLCRCASHVFEADPGRLPGPVRQRIQAAFPGWVPDLGLCRQCADLYRARAGMVAPALGFPAGGP